MPWSPFRRGAFRFVCAYLALFLFPFPIGSIPGTDSLSEACDVPWQVLAVWVGRHVLRLQNEITNFSKEGTDSTYGYVQLLCMVVVAAAGALAWSLLDRKRTDYRSAYGWLHLWVRYVLATSLLTYGLIKVIKVQFPDVSPSRLVQQVGDLSPMELLWTFMGYSRAYTFFAGAIELVAALLLFFRRTSRVGALLAVVALTNVVMLNLCYDVTVKLGSAQLLLLALFLLAPDARRLLDVLVLDRASAPPAPREPRFEGVWAKRGAVAVKVLFVGNALVGTAMGVWAAYHTFGDGAPSGPLDGLYEVEAFSRDGVAAPPLSTDRARWRWVSVAGERLSVQRMDGKAKRFGIDGGVQAASLTLHDKDDATHPFTYARPDEGHVELAGTLGGESLAVRLRRVQRSEFLLISRGFHWVNEYPVNY
jgi:hypothetical protein